MDISLLFINFGIIHVRGVPLEGGDKLGFRGRGVGFWSEGGGDNIRLHPIGDFCFAATAAVKNSPKRPF